MSLFRREVPPESLLEVDRSGATCRKHGHTPESQEGGTTWGYCKRCDHTFHRYSGRVLYYGEFYDRVPAHNEDAERRTARWAKDHTDRTFETERRISEARIKGQDTLALEQERVAQQREWKQAMGIET